MKELLTRLFFAAIAVFFAWSAIGNYRTGEDFSAALQAMVAVSFVIKTERVEL
jgi:hypothetical protein